MDIRNGECIELLKTIPDKSIDLFICDLPYGETNCKWDTKIDMSDFWKEFKRVRKSKRTACIHFCSTKFGYSLIKSNEGMFKMDMVWKKRNKTGGLQSRHRPMRNHEMVYFFYEQAPKYNRDKYHKRIVAKPTNKKKDEPINPVSVLEEATDVYGETKKKRKARRKKGDSNFEPVNPASVVEEKEGQIKAKDWGYKKCSKSFDNNEDVNGGRRIGANFEPPNPASVLIEDDRVDEKGKSAHGWDIAHMDKPRVAHFDPKLPASVLESHSDFGWETDKLPKDMRGKEGYEPRLPASVLEETEGKFGGKDYCYGNACKGNYTGKNSYGAFEPTNPVSVLEENEKPTRKSIKDRQGLNTKTDLYPPENRTSSSFEPTNPASVVVEDEYIIPAEDEPKSMYESTKVFIGKRNHQTEKPQDILEFFLKYWTDEDDVVLDPTMGSGSTGVACKKLNRKFIGFELDEKIFKVAEKRINK